MIYLLVKAAHLVAMVVWMAGMLAVPITFAGFGPTGPPADTRARLRWVFNLLCTPALLVVWGAGLTVATQGGWFADTWLQAKLALVLILSGLHGAMSGQLRRVEQADGGRGPVPALVRNLHWAVLTCVTAIVLLAVLKPG